MINRCTITFLPERKTVTVPFGMDLLTAAVKAHVFIASSCGGKGVCGRCRIKIIQGRFDAEPTGKLTSQEKEQNIHLACRTFARGDMEVEILPLTRLPEKAGPALFEKGQELKLREISLKEIFSFGPLTRKYHLPLPEPDLRDNISDLGRIFRGLKEYQMPGPWTDLHILRKLPAILRESNWSVTVTVADEDGRAKLVLVEPGDNSEKNYGIAVDVGTTTIVVSLIDLNTGETLKTEISFNRQAAFGEDVITRIVHAEKKEGLEQLHHLVVETINELIQDLAESSGVDLNDITCGVCSGNMTMTHLLLKIDPSFLRREPYVPTTTFFPSLPAAEAGIRINPAGVLGIIGGVSSYVGGDITSGVLVTRIYEKEKLQILVDVGTNGEIVLGNKDWLLCCSASAGPAFEGSGVRDGMRAIDGAVQSMEIKEPDRVVIGTVADEPALGICGSGYVEILCELFRHNLIDRSGRLVDKNPRVRTGQDGKEFVVAYAEETSGRKDVVITQVDIENLLRAKAAIFSGIATLVRKVGVKWAEVEKFHIAGGFGNYLNIRKSVCIGMLPDLPEEKFVFMGNTSLAGAKAFLLSRQARDLSGEIVKKMTYVDLSLEPTYMEEYLAAMFIPHTDASLFPSVEK